MTAIARGRRFATPRAIAVATIVGLFVSAPPAPAATPKPATPARLSAVTVVTGSQTRHMTVVLERSATLAYDLSHSRSPAVKTSGAGRFVGVVIAKQGVTASSAQWFAQLRTSACGVPGCRVVEPESADLSSAHVIAEAGGFPELDNGQNPERLTFPAGKYELTLVADGAPVTVTLSFQGLNGRSILRPTAAARTTIKSVPPTLLPNPAAATSFTVGDEVNIDAPLGIVAFSSAHQYTVSTGDVSDWCLYNGQQAPPGDTYLPGCPAGDGLVRTPSFIILQQGRDVPRGGYGIAFVRGHQTWGQGVYAVGANLLATVRPMSAFWLDLPTA